MHPVDKYQADCLRTSYTPDPFCSEPIQRKALSKIFEEMARCSEAADILKKHLIYGRPADLSQYEGATELAPTNKRVIHALLGIQSEIREVLDGLFRGDETTMMEDFGDIAWYIAEGLEGIHKTMSETMDRNLAKLKVRFPEKFSPELALGKDSARERVVLEGGVEDGADRQPLE